MMNVFVKFLLAALVAAAAGKESSSNRQRKAFPIFNVVKFKVNDMPL